ncbi:methylated-DNA--[protein]-cysteine S-methyltransferase [Streptomyces sp. NPDC053048]|uniref:methylated-DNA--[protein]-cysteine S-methyltransferase n=1 Tax=Streptomyces sp. NPDC053048 TaxID=3365694 RepID=UPI0037D2884C
MLYSKSVPPLANVAVTVHDTPMGRLVLGATDGALIYCGFAHVEMARRRISQRARECLADPSAFSAGQADVLAQARSEIDGYLAGRSHSFSVPVDLRLATPFSKEVLLALEDLVPYGWTTTYAEVARQLNRAGAARAVGAALGANPVCVVLPCHRVVGASGRLTGYAGGIPAKRALLALEAEEGSRLTAPALTIPGRDGRRTR